MMKKIATYLLYSVAITCITTNLQASNYKDISAQLDLIETSKKSATATVEISTLPDLWIISGKRWQDGVAPYLRAKDYCILRQVSRAGNEIFSADETWKHIVARYYPEFLVNELQGRYYSAALNILDNRFGITYNSQQHREIKIYALNFDGTILAGRTNYTSGYKAYIGRFENNKLKDILVSEFEGIISSISWDGSLAAGYLIKEGEKQAIIWDQLHGIHPVKFPCDVVSSEITLMSGNGQKFFSTAYDKLGKKRFFLFSEEITEQSTSMEKSFVPIEIEKFEAKSMNFDGTVLAGAITDSKGKSSFGNPQAAVWNSKLNQLKPMTYRSSGSRVNLHLNHMTADSSRMLGYDTEKYHYYICTHDKGSKMLFTDMLCAEASTMSQDGRRIITQALNKHNFGDDCMKHKAIIVYNRDSDKRINLDEMFHKNYKIENGDQVYEDKFIEQINYEDPMNDGKPHGFKINNICTNYPANVIAFNTTNFYAGNEYVNEHDTFRDDNLKCLMKVPRDDLLRKEGVKYKK